MLYQDPICCHLVPSQDPRCYSFACFRILHWFLLPLFFLSALIRLCQNGTWQTEGLTALTIETEREKHCGERRQLSFKGTTNFGTVCHSLKDSVNISRHNVDRLGKASICRECTEGAQCLVRSWISLRAQSACAGTICTKSNWSTAPRRTQDSPIQLFARKEDRRTVYTSHRGHRSGKGSARVIALWKRINNGNGFIDTVRRRCNRKADSCAFLGRHKIRRRYTQLAEKIICIVAN